ncbi:MAG: hypothetical protein KKA07_11425 [Bacteroidetes bacterium]|nr:hypothetical protein [Bacteroidota bacterium]MBU1719670.1 hypothetical protein [Bacteroidota bacterium]
MTQQTTKDWEQFFNPEEIKQHLIEASLFLSFFEILNNEIIERIFNFYSPFVVDGKRIPSDEYKKQIIGRKIYGKNNNNVNIFLSSCQWLVDQKAISQEEYDLIAKIKDHRNQIAHDLTKFLFDSNYLIDKDLFSQIKTITLKIEKWWAAQPDKKRKTAEDSMPGQKLILDCIFDVATSTTH